MMDFTLQATQFWQAWQQKQTELYQLKGLEFVEKANELLDLFFDGVGLELENADNPTQGTLIFTAHGKIENFAKIDAITTHPLAEPYTVVAYRQPMTAKSVKDFTITMGEIQLSMEQLQIAICTSYQLVDIEIRLDVPYTEENLEQIKNMAFIMLDHVLGERVFAIYVGYVDFVEHFSEGFTPIAHDDLLERIAHIWHNELEHTGIYPQGEHEYEVGKIYGQEELLLTFNLSAQSLIGSPLAWCIRIMTHIHHADEVEQAQDLESSLDEIMTEEHQAINALVIFNLTQGVRTIYCYCKYPHVLMSKLQPIIQQSPLSSQFEIDYDPRWDWYRIKE